MSISLRLTKCLLIESTPRIKKKKKSLHGGLISKTFHIRIHKRVKYFFSWRFLKHAVHFFSGLLEFPVAFNKR